jgi:hypothetical protein
VGWSAKVLNQATQAFAKVILLGVKGKREAMLDMK